MIFTDEKPEAALECETGLWECVIRKLSSAVRSGQTVSFNGESVGCPGGKAGLCFGNIYDQVPIEDFLSSGSEDGSLEGEGFKKTPQLARIFIESLPEEKIPEEFVVFKRLSEVSLDRERLTLVIFLVNADQLSALVVLANYGRPGNDSVTVPWGAACHTICLFPYQESKKEWPKAIIGLTDITARPYIRREILSFTVPFRMFEEMEANVPGSFLQKKAWEKVRKRI